MSPMCCTRLAEIQDTKITPKIAICGLRTIVQVCRATSSHLRHDRQSEKNLLNDNISSICPYNMVNFGPLTAKICWRVWGTPANVNGFRVLASLLQRRRSTEVNQTLHDVWPYPQVVYYICIFGEGCCP